MDELGRIQTFIKVAQAGSFSAVARNASSISSVARQVKSLEDELGVRLFNRSTRSLSLTEPGRLFFERAQLIAHDLGNAISEVQSFKTDVKGVLRVAFRVSVGTTVVIPALPAFLQRYPELSLEVILTDDRQDLIANDIDVAIWMGSMPNADIVARQLSPQKRIVCGSPSYFDKHGMPQTPADLLDHECILYSAPHYKTSWAFTQSGVREDIPVRGKIKSANSLVLLSSALVGLGIILVHDWMVSGLIQQRRLARVLPQYQVSPGPGDADLFAVYPSSRVLSLKVRAFVDFLVALFAQENQEQLGQ
jgi:DNA-binding transcriptional LysR family regulator